MPKIKKTRQKRGLDSVRTFITDTSENSPSYFNILQLGEEFNLGKNGFAVQGTKNLRPGAEIAIEILDSRGDVIYHEIRNYEEDVKRVVGVFVYQDTPPGQGQITVLSEAIRDQDGTPVPPEQRDQFNVKWTRSINVNPNDFNEDQIRFIRSPEIIVDDQQYVKKRGKFANELSAFERVGSPDFTPIEVEQQAEDFSSFPLYTVSQGTPVVRGTFYPPKQWPYGYFIVESIDFDWISNMEGETLIVSSESLPLNQNLTIRLDEIINKKYARFHVITDAYNQFLKKFTFDTDQFFLLYERDAFAYEEQERSYLKNIQLGFIQTLTGECVRAQIYNRLRGENETFEFVGNFEIEPVELMADVSDSRVKLISPVGTIPDQSHIDKFFDSSPNTALEYDDDFLSNSVRIHPNTLSSSSEHYEMSIDFTNPNIQRFTFFSYSEYTLSFQTSFGSNAPVDSTLEVFVTGAPFYDTMKKLAEIDLEQETYHFEEVSENFLPNQTAESYQPDSTSFSFEIVFRVTTHVDDVDHSWYVRDISLRPAQETGFSPDYTILKVPIDTTKYGLNEIQGLVYKVDLFDLNGNKAGVNLISS